MSWASRARTPSSGMTSPCSIACGCCRIHFGAPPAPPAPPPPTRHVALLGLDLCFDTPPTTAPCDVRLPPLPVTPSGAAPGERPAWQARR